MWELAVENLIPTQEVMAFRYRALQRWRVFVGQLGS